MHYNGNYRQDIQAEDLLKVDDPRDYPPSAQLAMQLSHKDVWLDYFFSCQPLIAKLKGRDELKVDADGCRNLQGRLVLKFSKEMTGKIEAQKGKNYLPKTAKVRFIVYWQKDDTDTEICIILPELYFERVGLAEGFKERDSMLSN